MLFVFLEDGACAGVWVFIDALNFDALSWGWGVYVFALAEVDAYVVCAVSPEYEVSWLEVGGGDWFCVGLLGVSDTWEADATFFVDVLYESTAVEACWGGATPYVWDTEVFECGGGDLFTFGFLHVCWIDFVGGEFFPHWCVGVGGDEDEVAVHDGDGAVGEGLDERHWGVGGAFYHFDWVFVSVCGETDGGVLFVII